MNIPNFNSSHCLKSLVCRELGFATESSSVENVAELQFIANPKRAKRKADAIMFLNFIAITYASKNGLIFLMKDCEREESNLHVPKDTRT